MSQSGPNVREEFIQEDEKPSPEPLKSYINKTSQPEDTSRLSAGRNLVICIDGTSNQFGIENTNVVQLYQGLVKNKNQVTYYNSGIGTYANLSRISPKYILQTLKGFLHCAFAWRVNLFHALLCVKAYEGSRNVEEIVVDAYRWLAENYEDGDRIYLFGFSRGAYQVRALAGMIQKVGLIHRGNVAQIPFAYELYISQKDREKTNHLPPYITWPVILVYIAIRSCVTITIFFSFIMPLFIPVLWFANDKNLAFWIRLFWSLFSAVLFSVQLASGSLEIIQERIKAKEVFSAEELARTFKDSFSWPDARIRFVGCWDTVSSIGLFRRTTLPLTDIVDHVETFRHALALDECRVKFIPEYTSTSRSAPTRNDINVHVKEVWFAGSHSDVGGRNSIRQLKKEAHESYWNPSLQWMVQEARHHGLMWADDDTAIVGKNLSRLPLANSMTMLWWLVEWLPVAWPVYSNGQIKLTRELHRGRKRQIVANQRIHFSALLDEKYTPAAVLNSRSTNKATSLNAPLDQDLSSPLDGAQRSDGDTWADLRSLDHELIEFDANTYKSKEEVKKAVESKELDGGITVEQKEGILEMVSEDMMVMYEAALGLITSS